MSGLISPRSLSPKRDWKIYANRADSRRPKQMEELSPLEKDTISEVGNISLGASATALSTIINKRVEITTPRLEILTVNEVKHRFPVPCLVSVVSYRTGLHGKNILLITDKDARAIAALMIGRSTGDLDKPMGSLEISAIQEAMNQMMGYMATAMSEMFKRRIDLSPPIIELRNLAEKEPALEGLRDQDSVVQIAFKISVADLIDSSLVQLIPLPSAREMVGFLLGTEVHPQPEPESDSPVNAPEPAPHGGEAGMPVDERRPEQEAPGPVEDTAESFYDEEPLSCTRDEADPDGADTFDKLDLVRDLPMDITVILGKTRMPLGSLLTLGKGGIIELDGYVDEKVELLVNGKLVAFGEVVMINERLGVRITKMRLEAAVEGQ
ncbi:MAG: flagellar motor switch phosphatase FliY [Bacillota bacterium]